MGSCTAYALAKKGYKVALLEQFAFLHRKGSSHGESRIIRKTYPEDYHVEMMHVAYDLWEEAQAEAGLRVYTHTGGLDVAHKDAPAIQSLIAGCIKHGAPIEVLDPVEAAARFPQLHLPEDFIAVVNPDSGVLNASRSTGMFQDLARRRGAILKDNLKVERIEERRNGLLVRLLSGRRDSVVLHTDQGEFTAAKCVVTAGAWAGKVLEQYLGQPLKLQPLHTTVAYDLTVSRAGRAGGLTGPEPRYWRCPKPELFEAARPFPVFIHYGESLELYGTPILEYPGCVKFSLHGGPPCDPDERSCIPRVQDLEGEATELMRRLLPDVDWSKPVMAESCMYTNTVRTRGGAPQGHGD